MKVEIGSQEEKDFGFDHPSHPKHVNFELVDTSNNNQIIGTFNLDMSHTNISLSKDLMLINGNLKKIYV